MEPDQWNLNQAEKKRIGEFLLALRRPCSVQRNQSSFFNTTEFEDDFRSRLLAHHEYIRTPLFQDSFHSAFIEAARGAGLNPVIAPSGARFWDLEIAGRRISLKSSKAKNMRPDLLHISKLTEAAWIQDCRTSTKRREETFRLFNEYTTNVHSIIQLRYFYNKEMYELVEFPASLFRQIFDVQREHFNADGPTINIPIGKEPPDFTLKLDRSDAKITIANINKLICTVHGTWELK